jgi:hypothetical protein
MKIALSTISVGKIARMSGILLIPEHTQKLKISDETGGCSA